MSAYVPSDEAVGAAAKAIARAWHEDPVQPGDTATAHAALTAAVPVELERVRERVAEGLHDALVRHHGGLPWAELDGPHRRNTYERVDQMLGLDALPGEKESQCECEMGWTCNFCREFARGYNGSRNLPGAPSELQGEPSLEVGESDASEPYGGWPMVDSYPIPDGDVCPCYRTVDHEPHTHILDAPEGVPYKCPGWPRPPEPVLAVYEDAGRIRFVNKMGEQTPIVLANGDTFSLTLNLTVGDA